MARAIADDYCSHVTAFGFPNRAGEPGLRSE